MSLGPSLRCQLISSSSCISDLFCCCFSELHLSIFNFSFLSMCLLWNLSCFYRINRKKVSWDVILYPNTRCVLHLFQMHETFCLYEVQVFFCVLRLVVIRFEMQRVLRSIILIVVVNRQVVVQVATVYWNTCFVSPATCNISYSVATSAQNHCWYLPTFDKLDTIPVASDRCIMCSKFVSS